MAVASERIRILVTDLPRMLREIIESAVADQCDMELVTRPESQPRLVDALAGDADVVILGADHLQAVLILLEAHPKMTVIGIIAGGQEALLYRTRPERFSLGELSPHTLVSAIRHAAQIPWKLPGASDASSSIEPPVND